MMKKTLPLLISFLVASFFLAACSSPQLEPRSTKTPGAVKAPASDAFYTPPSTLPVTEPGSIIWSQLLSDSPKNVNAWRVLYVTTGINNTPVATSALLYAPRDNKKHRIIAWAHGTTGIADICAPSREDNPDENIPYFKDYIDKGYAIVAPDYEGLGTPGTHPYLVGSSEGRSILDALRMAQSFDPINPVTGGVVVGHSQGGHAALFAGQLQSTYAPDLELDGVVSVAPPGKLEELYSHFALSPITYGLAVMGAVGFTTARPDLDLSQVFPAEVLAKSSVVMNDCLSGIIQTYVGDAFLGLVAQPENVLPWPELFEENSPGNIKIDAPVLIEHGLKDSTVPAIISKSIFESSCEVDTKISRITYAGRNGTHSGVLEMGRKDTLAFIEDRFSGKRFESMC
ncbi:MAG TPA: alpha/beta fold hydrolase [Acidimicrobiia bacterium]|nr:alpha/beta fold hydrolase [Acidimicrobiia bacterium]